MHTACWRQGVEDLDHDINYGCMMRCMVTSIQRFNYGEDPNKGAPAHGTGNPELGAIAA